MSEQLKKLNLSQPVQIAWSGSERLCKTGNGMALRAQKWGLRRLQRLPDREHGDMVGLEVTTEHQVYLLCADTTLIPYPVDEQIFGRPVERC